MHSVHERYVDIDNQEQLWRFFCTIISEVKIRP